MTPQEFANILKGRNGCGAPVKTDQRGGKGPQMKACDVGAYGICGTLASALGGTRTCLLFVPGGVKSAGDAGARRFAVLPHFRSALSGSRLATASA